MDDKFGGELDVNLLLKKLRTSYDIVRGQNNKTHMEFLKYHKSRVIDLDMSSASSSSDMSSSDDEKDKNLSVYD